MRLRDVTAADRELLFSWANDADARRFSVSTEPIPWDDHVRWLAAKTADPACELWIGVDDDGADAGLARFDCEGDEAEIGVTVAPDRRGRGVGATLIAAACERLFAERNIGVVVARIKHENIASQRSFANAGFAPAGEQEARGAVLLRYERRSPERAG